MDITTVFFEELLVHLKNIIPLTDITGHQLYSYKSWRWIASLKHVQACGISSLGFQCSTPTTQKEMVNLGYIMGMCWNDSEVNSPS